MENTKICTKCGRELPLSEFNKDKSRKDGLQCWCKSCKKQYGKQYRADNPEKMKQWYATLEGYARQIRYHNLQADRKYGRCGKDEDPLAPLEYYVWGIQQRDFYDGKQYHWSEMGFDRIDNSKPHTIDNIVPCSTKNNIRRQKMPFEEFCELMKNEELELIL